MNRAWVVGDRWAISFSVVFNVASVASNLEMDISDEGAH
jgi:hypothetical protein